MKGKHSPHSHHRKQIIVWLGSYLDQPEKIFQQKRSFEVARTPYFDQFMREAQTGFLQLVDKNFPFENAGAFLNLFSKVLGSHQSIIGEMEAMGLGFQIPPGYLVFRCDLVTVSNQILLGWSAGHISGEETKMLIKSLEESLSNEKVKFLHSGANRSLLLVSEELLEGSASELQCLAPWAVKGKPTDLNFPKGKGSEFIANIMRHSMDVFQKHEVNQIRLDLGENPASMVWIWGGR